MLSVELRLTQLTLKITELAQKHGVSIAPFMRLEEIPTPDRLGEAKIAAHELMLKMPLPRVDSAISPPVDLRSWGENKARQADQTTWVDYVNLLGELSQSTKNTVEVETSQPVGTNGAEAVGTGRTPETKVTLDRESMVILKVLANSDVFLTQVQITTRTDETDDDLGKNLDRKTVSNRLKEMKKNGFVKQPKGVRQGWIITAKGREIIPPKPPLNPH